MTYVTYIMNHIPLASLDWQTPYFRAFGTTRDISPFLLYQWWEPIYYYASDIPFHESREKLGHFAGFVDNVGDSFCFKIVSADNDQILYRSVLRSALDTTNSNFRAVPEHLLPASTNGERTETLPKLLLRDASEPGILSEIPTNRVHYFNPNELVGKTFLRERDADGTIHRAEIIVRIENSESIPDQYLVKFGDGEREEVMSCNAIVDH